MRSLEDYALDNTVYFISINAVTGAHRRDTRSIHGLSGRTRGIHGNGSAAISRVPSLGGSCRSLRNYFLQKSPFYPLKAFLIYTHYFQTAHQRLHEPAILLVDGRLKKHTTFLRNETIKTK